MPNTYTQLHVQFVFAVQYRAALIGVSWKERLHQYITGIFQNKQHKMLQINSMPDHIHILIGFRPNQSISSLIQLVKSESTKWINDNKLAKTKFAWQSGYGAFSYGKSQLSQVIAYIRNQEKHHKKQTFLDEYRAFLKAFEIEYDKRYIHNTYLTKHHLPSRWDDELHTIPAATHISSAMRTKQSLGLLPVHQIIN